MITESANVDSNIPINATSVHPVGIIFSTCPFLCACVATDVSAEAFSDRLCTESSSLGLPSLYAVKRLKRVTPGVRLPSQPQDVSDH